MNISDFQAREILESQANRRAYAHELSAIREGKPTVSEVQLSQVANLLRNIDYELTRSQNRIRENTFAADIGDFRRFAFPVVSAVYPNLESEKIVSIQTMKQRTCQAFFLDIVAGTDKGRINKGDVLFTGRDIAGTSNKSYSAELIDYEAAADVNKQTSITFSTEFKPVRPKTIKIELVTSGTPTYTFYDDGAGTLSDPNDADQTGTINYATGAVAITLDTAFTGGIEYSYEYNNEYAGHGGSQAPEINLTIREITLKARSRKLRTNYTWDAAYDLQMSQGLDMDQVLLEAATAALKSEIDEMVMDDLYNGAALSSTWDEAQPQYISKKEHLESFLYTLTEDRNKIYHSTRRVEGNFIIAGRKAATILESIGEPRYKANGNIKPGAYESGTLDGSTIVIKNPKFPEDAYLVGYKGDLFIDAGYILGVYLPLFSTNVIMLDDFVGRRGYGMSIATRLVKPNYFVKGTIVDTTP